MARSHQQVFVRAEFLLKEGIHCLVLLVSCKRHWSIRRSCDSRVSVWCVRARRGHFPCLDKGAALSFLGNVDIIAVRCAAQANHHMP